MKFEELNLANKAELQEKIRELYGLELANAECHFSSRNFVFVFSAGCRPTVLRIGLNSKRSRHDLLSELLWVDDLRDHVSGIASVVPSSDGSLEKNFQIGDYSYYVSQFRKANGAVPIGAERNETYYRQAGKLLGKIHSISREEVKSGFRFKRFQWYEKNSFQPDVLRGFVEEDTILAIEKLMDTMRQIPQTPEVYGMIHGDYQFGNLFLDWDNLWVFDFDDCCYGYFIYDIACAMFSFVYDIGYRPETSRSKLYQELLLLFREGYESEYQLPQEQWELLDKAIVLRVAESLMLIVQNPTIPKPVLEHLIKNLSYYILHEDSFWEDFDRTFERTKREGYTREKLFASDDRVKIKKEKE